jgi:hypothetical protein
MTAKPKDSTKRESEPEKKKSDTVQLSAEELRKIAGGSSTKGPGPSGGQLKNLPGT